MEPSASPQVRAQQAGVDASLLSHILTTPLAGIVLWCDMLRSHGGLTELVDRGLIAIDHSVHAQLAILDNLVELARWQAGAFDVHRARLDLVAGVQDVVARNASAARQRRVAIRFEPPPGEHVVDADPLRLRTALRNLLDNAVNASPPDGNVDITIERSVDTVSIRIADEGTGIAPELARSLTIGNFASAGISRRGGRLGLGLPVARWIVELHGGTLTATSRPPRGSCFAIAWPTGR